MLLVLIIDHARLNYILFQLDFLSRVLYYGKGSRLVYQWTIQSGVGTNGTYYLDIWWFHFELGFVLRLVVRLCCALSHGGKHLLLIWAPN